MPPCFIHGGTTPSHIVITNNLVHDEPGSGIEADYITITDKTVNDNTNWSPNDQSGISLFEHVDFVANTANQNQQTVPQSRQLGELFADDGGDDSGGSDNPKNANPQFTNPSTGDFSIGATSPARSVGTSIMEPKTDIVGTARPQAHGYDIGAYESMK